MPSHIAKGKRKSLQDVDRLGHSIVFRFDTSKGILGIQYDSRVMAPFRFFQYVQSFNTDAKFTAEAVVRDDMWERFERGDVKVLEVAIANPSDLGALGNESEALASSFKNMARAYDAPNITVRIGMGHHKGHLPTAIKQTVQDLLNRRAAGSIAIDKLRARSADSEGTEPIDLLGEMLEYKEELDLHNKDPDANYNIKLAYVKRCMANVR